MDEKIIVDGRNYRLELDNCGEYKIVVEVNDNGVYVSRCGKYQVDECGAFLYHNEWERVRSFVEKAVKRMGVRQ